MFQPNMPAGAFAGLSGKNSPQQPSQMQSQPPAPMPGASPSPFSQMQAPAPDQRAALLQAMLARGQAGGIPTASTGV